MSLKRSKLRLHGLVVVPNPSGNVRLGVDMRQANKVVQRERFPISNIEDTLYQMNGATVFLKLYLTQSLHQIEHEESSRCNTTFVCHKGLYRYKRLMFGINSAPELHQRIIQQTIQDIPGCKNLTDDINIYAKNPKDHDKTLRAPLSMFRQKQMRIQQVKTEIYGAYIVKRWGETK